MVTAPARRVLVALGGNAMTGPDGSATPDAQKAAVSEAMEHVGDLVASGVQVVLTHGNGPQVGNLLVKNELAASVVPPVPLDWCGAQTQGTIALLMVNALQAALARRRVDRPVAALVTRTLVDRDDPGFAHPTKPVGRYVSAEEAQRYVALGQNWEDRGERGWRRVVASPEPRQVVDADAVATLVDMGFVVVAAGGGGIPVVRGADGALAGVEAVLDKDLTAALLARRLSADVMVVATDVDHVVTGFGTGAEQPVGRVTVAEMRDLQRRERFASGSMGPKVEAALRFVEAGGRMAAITSLHRITEATSGRAGTIVTDLPMPTRPEQT